MADCLRIGVVGLGRGFVLTLPALIAHPQLMLTAAADPQPESRALFAAQFGARTYEDADALFADPEVDAVYIASPHQFHPEQAIAAAQAGKHVLVEKPMASCLADARRMVDAAASAGIVLMVGPSHGLDSPVILAERLIRGGSLGAPRMAVALNYTDFLYRPRRPEELCTSQGGGVIFSQGAHQIDIIRRLIGAPIKSVRATTGNWDPKRSTEGAYSAMLTFDNGACATLTYSGYAHFDSDVLTGGISELGYPKDLDRYGAARRALVALDTDEAAAKVARTYGVAATPAAAQYNEHFGFVLVSCEGGDLRLDPKGVYLFGHEEQDFVPAPPGPVQRFGTIDMFVQAILLRNQPLQHGAWALETVACCVAILKSAATASEILLAELLCPQAPHPCGTASPDRTR